MKIFSKINKAPLLAALFLILFSLPVAAHAATCTKDGDCLTGTYCSGGAEDSGSSGICLPSFAEGAACTRRSQCQTPYCTSGVCSATPPPAETTTTPSEKPPAQQLINPIGGTAENPAGVTTVSALIANIIKAVLGIVGAVALFMFVWGGFTWLTSGGSPDKIKMGRDTLVWATIGLLVIFASYTLVETIFKALGAIP